MNIRQLVESLNKAMRENNIEYKATFPFSGTVNNYDCSGDIFYTFDGDFGYCENVLGNEKAGFKSAVEAFEGMKEDLEDYFNNSEEDFEGFEFDEHIVKGLKKFEHDCVFEEE